MFLLTFLFTYTVSSIFCFVVDLTSDYRVIQKSRVEILNDYKKMLPSIVLNLGVSIPLIYYMERLYLIHYFTRITRSFVLNSILWLILCDLLFYLIHRLLHNRRLFFIHRKHHEFDYTYGAGAIYAHPLDFVIANIFPIGFPLIFFNVPYYQCVLIISFSSFFTVVFSHGGYFITQAHLLHHIKKMGNYGLIFTDRLFKTTLR